MPYVWDIEPTAKGARKTSHCTTVSTRSRQQDHQPQEASNTNGEEVKQIKEIA